MTDTALLSKFATLPADLQAQAADFIDFLVQKAARNSPPKLIPEPEKPLTNPTDGNKERPEIIVEHLGPLTESGEPRISLQRGAGKHLITYIADDFDAPLDEFKDYM